MPAARALTNVTDRSNALLDVILHFYNNDAKWARVICALPVVDTSTPVHQVVKTAPPGDCHRSRGALRRFGRYLPGVQQRYNAIERPHFLGKLGIAARN